MSFVQNINGKFEKITEASWYKILMPKLYGWGAAVVILGALFKIENLPGAGTMLMIGLGLESIIFSFSQLLRKFTQIMHMVQIMLIGHKFILSLQICLILQIKNLHNNLMKH